MFWKRTTPQVEALIQDALLSTAQWLRTIHDQVVEKMNEGKWLEDIIREMEYPEELAKKPWARGSAPEGVGLACGSLWRPSVGRATPAASTLLVRWG